MYSYIKSTLKYMRLLYRYGISKPIKRKFQHVNSIEIEYNSNNQHKIFYHVNFSPFQLLTWIMKVSKQTKGVIEY